MPTPSTPASAQRYPPQISYIIGNEACERFSFYGMRNILTVFLINYLLVQHVPDLTERQGAAKGVFHLFVAIVYWFPLLGGFLADRVLGKYRTILWLSLLYCVGHALLAIFDENRYGFYSGLFLIALGSGGIKPCVSSFVGDQFTEANKGLVKGVFSLFYWIINFGSFFASLLIPLTLEKFGPPVAFGIPGVLMFIATVIFWAGRRTYTDVPPAGTSRVFFFLVTLGFSLFAAVIVFQMMDRNPLVAIGTLGAMMLAAALAFWVGRRIFPATPTSNPHSVFWVVWHTLFPPKPPPAGSGWLDRASAVHPPEAIEATRAVFRVMGIFAMIPVFWALFDQKASTWVVQATQMDLMVGSIKLAPSQLQALNPLMVMMLIPLNTFVLFPWLESRGLKITPLRRMATGMFIAGFSYVLVGVIQLTLDGGNKISVLWQAGPYLVLTLAEVLVSATGLEFAYSQAPREVKGIIMGMWNVTVTVGNLLVAVVAQLNVFEGAAGTLFFYAGLIFVAAIVFALIASFYKVRDYYQPAALSPVPDRTVPSGEPVGDSKVR
jgi:POT family proton-dependent oligopeptide transporter